MIMFAVTKRFVLCVAALCAPVAAVAAGSSYMSLLGELVGKAEMPRMLRDICIEASPETVKQNARAYEEWAQRNADLLSAVKVQQDRGDVRLAKQATQNPGSPKSTREVIAMLQQVLAEQVSQAGPAAGKDMCSKYAGQLSSTEETRKAEIQSLLKTVTNADKALSTREAQQ
jgi:hypothetical protein